MSVNSTIKDRGAGTRKIAIKDSLKDMTSNDVFLEEEFEGTPEPLEGHRRKTREQLGMDPIQTLYIDADMIKKNKYIFFTEVESKPRDTSNNAKLMFREELRDLQAMQQMGSTVNIEGVQNDYAIIWNKRKDKLFGKPQELAEEAKNQGGGNVLDENIPQLEPQSQGQIA